MSEDLAKLDELLAPDLHLNKTKQTRRQDLQEIKANLPRTLSCLNAIWGPNANRIIDDEQTPQQRSFTWATTRRHVLCGEERLTVSYDDASDEVHFEVLSFSRPRHLFSWAAYPYVVAQQKRFARDATERMVTAVERQ